MNDDEATETVHTLPFSEESHFYKTTCISMQYYQLPFQKTSNVLFGNYITLIRAIVTTAADGSLKYYSIYPKNKDISIWLTVLGFIDMSTLVGHFVLSPREREKRDKRDSRRDEREGPGRKRNRNESEETEEMKTFPFYPYLLQG